VAWPRIDPDLDWDGSEHIAMVEKPLVVRVAVSAPFPRALTPRNGTSVHAAKYTVAAEKYVRGLASERPERQSLMGIFNRRPPEWAQMLTAQVAQVNQKLDNINTGVNKIMTEDSAIEAEVTLLTTDVTTLQTLGGTLLANFNALAAEVAGGGTPSDQAMTDLSSVVTAITTGIAAIPTGPTPPAPAPSP
jgi:uncharacterized phage infection (PIP) family protein YhgE